MGTSLPIQIRWILCGCGCFYSLIPSLLTISFEPLFLWLPPSLQSLSSYIIVVWKIFFQSQLLSAFGCCPIVNVVQYKIFCIILSMYMHTSYCFWLTAFLSLIPCVKDQCTCSYSPGPILPCLAFVSVVSLDTGLEGQMSQLPSNVRKWTFIISFCGGTLLSIVSTLG